MKNKRICFQWSVYLVSLPDTSQNVQAGFRPCICVSNDLNNTWSPTAQFIPLTSQHKNNLPVHYILHNADYNFLRADSVVLVEQLTTQNVDNVAQFLGRLNARDIEGIKECIKTEFNLY